MKKNLQQLKKEALKISNEIRKIERVEVYKVQNPRLKNMIGWCMKSTYDDKESKTFSKILEWVDSKWGITFILEEIRLNSSGEVSIRITSNHPYTNKAWWKAEIPLFGIKRISESTYEQEKAKLLNLMLSRDLLRKYILKGK